ncbi:Uncharacterised protein [Mycobacteroides abscessus subsp. abscessus]|nr:Uncharacterised protein [Mycobacteroides abscessus subsp. abscessus]
MRVAERSRWWCTAAVSSSDGMGAQVAEELRSDSTMYCTPRWIAAETFSQISVIRARRAAAPPAGS